MRFNLVQRILKYFPHLTEAKLNQIFSLIIKLIVVLISLHLAIPVPIFRIFKSECYVIFGSDKEVSIKDIEYGRLSKFQLFCKEDEASCSGDILGPIFEAYFNYLRERSEYILRLKLRSDFVLESFLNHVDSQDLDMLKRLDAAGLYFLVDDLLELRKNQGFKRDPKGWQDWRDEHPFTP